MSQQTIKGSHQEAWVIPNFLSVFSQTTSSLTRDFLVEDNSIGSVGLQASLSVNRFTQKMELTITLVDNTTYSKFLARVYNFELLNSSSNIRLNNSNEMSTAKFYQAVGSGYPPMASKVKLIQLTPDVGITGENSKANEVDLCIKSLTADSILHYASLVNEIKRHNVSAYLGGTSLSVTIKFTLNYKIYVKLSAFTAPLGTFKNPKMDFQAYGAEVLNNFESLLQDKSTTDVVIKATLWSQKEFHCHKVILIARSPIFRALFDNPMKVVVVDDVGPDTMEHFISFLYCGRFQNDNWVKYLPNLTYVADKYCVASLKELCDKNLIKSVTCQNALAIANLAQRHQLATAISLIRRFIEKNAGKLNLDIASASEGLEIGD